MRKALKEFFELIPEYTDDMKQEYIDFMYKVKHTSVGENRFYVYFLCHQEGYPFYIGKGTGDRTWQHFVDFAKGGYESGQRKHNLITEVILKTDDFPIVYLFKSGLTDKDAYALEKQLIEEYGRYGVDENGSLMNIMPGGMGYSEESKNEIGGKIGGKTTRQNGSGIFREDLQHLRTEWAKIGAASLAERGTRGGCCTSEWWSIPENCENGIATARIAGKIGGKTTGSKPWWNDGVKNKRSHECPGPDYVKGMIPSEKKLKQLAAGREKFKQNLEAKRLATK